MKILCVEDDPYFFETFERYTKSLVQDKSTSISIERVGTVEEAVAAVKCPDTCPNHVFFDFDLNPDFKDPDAESENRVSALTQFVNQIDAICDKPSIHVMSGITLDREPIRQCLRHHLYDRDSIASVIRKKEADLLSFAIQAIYQTGAAIMDPGVAQMIKKTTTQDRYLGFEILDLPRKVQSLTNTQWEVSLLCFEGLTRVAIARKRNVGADWVAQTLGKTRDDILGDERNPALNASKQGKPPAPGAFVRFIVDRYLQKYGDRNRNPYL